MKNIYTYYLAIILPLLSIIYVVLANELNSWQFVGLLAFYVVYRTWTDSSRLIQKGVIG